VLTETVGAAEMDGEAEPVMVLAGSGGGSEEGPIPNSAGESDKEAAASLAAKSTTGWRPRVLAPRRRFTGLLAGEEDVNGPLAAWTV
jgi:hypothetical protein